MALRIMQEQRDTGKIYANFIAAMRGTFGQNCRKTV